MLVYGLCPLAHKDVIRMAQLEMYFTVFGMVIVLMPPPFKSLRLALII